MNQVNLEFKYKGNRDYVHGTDIYEKVVSNILIENNNRQISLFQMTIHNRVHNQCLLYYDSWYKTIKRPNKAKVEFTVSEKSTELIGWLVETESPVLKSYNYDESSIIKNCTFDGSRINYKDRSNFLPIEIIVAMNKCLHEKFFKNVDGRKWFFTRLELSRMFEDATMQEYQINIINHFQNKFTKSAIEHNGKLIGFIYFTLV